MQVTSLIILLVAIPIVFCMLTWVVATAYRLYFPDKPLPLENELTFISRAESTTVDLPVPVGVREIKEDQRRRSGAGCSYCFAHGISNGVPSGWLEDMWRRRN